MEMTLVHTRRKYFEELCVGISTILLRICNGCKNLYRCEDYNNPRSRVPVKEFSLLYIQRYKHQDLVMCKFGGLKSLFCTIIYAKGCCESPQPEDQKENYVMDIFEYKMENFHIRNLKTLFVGVAAS